MPTTTRANLRKGLARTLGLYEEFVTTTDITTNNNVVSTGLTTLGHTIDDTLIGKWIFIKGATGVNVNAARMVNDYTASSGTIVVRGVVLAGEADVNCELMEFSADKLHDALNTARLEAWPYLYRHVQWDTMSANYNQHEILMPSNQFKGSPYEVLLSRLIEPGTYAENYITDADTAEFNSVSGWTGANTSALSVISGTSSPATWVVLDGPSGSAGYCKTNGNSSAATVLHTLATNTTSIRGARVNFSIWVYYVGNKSTIKARILEDSDAEDGDYHNVGGWQKLTVSKDIRTDFSSAIKVGVVDTGNTANEMFYMDNAIVTVGAASIAELRYERLYNWQYLEPTNINTAGGTLVFPYQLTPKRLLRLRGRYLLSSVAAETDKMEIDEKQAELLYAFARVALYRSERGMREPDSRSWRKYDQLYKDAMSDRELLKAHHGMSQPGKFAGSPDWVPSGAI